jgi:hypothetical protein
MESTNNYTFQLSRSLQSLDITARKANFIRSQSGISNLRMILLLSWHACHKGYPLGTTTQLPAVGWGSVAQGLLWLLCVCVYLWNEAPYCPLRQCSVGRRRGYSLCTSDRLLFRRHIVAVPANWRALAKAIFREKWPCSNCNIPVIWVIVVFHDGRIHKN